MTSSANALLETCPSFKPGSVLVRGSATSLLGAAMLLTLGETASAQEQADTLANTDDVPEAATTGEQITDSEGEAEASTPQEFAAPARASTSVDPNGSVRADTSCEAPASNEAPVSDEAIAPSSLSPEQSRALLPLSWKKSPGQGFSFGMEEGLWGNSWSQGLRVTIPFTQYLGTTLRGVYLIEMGNDQFTADAGGRIDFFGRSAVLFNVVRLYGGGGVQVLAPAANTSGRSAKVGVGGHFGFEFFHNPYFSYFLEVGGQGGEPSPGATVVAGMMFYPWTR